MKKVCVAMLFLAGIWGVSAQDDGQAVVLEIQGRVELQDEGSAEWRAAAAGDLIGSNTVIATGLKSSALIALGSSRVEALPLTMLTLRELIQRSGGETTNLYLRTGRVRATVNPPAGQTIDFTVAAPNVTASVRGTSFEFDGRQLRVEKGLVLLSVSNGQKVYVSAAQRSYIDENNQNRIVPPFEAEAELLKPVIPELNSISSNAGMLEARISLEAEAASINVDWP
ncbi:MAG: FecR family protein [Spirochaetaceae bacterium]|jgi:hypothetical protein|nr:FecR family protein [Spirochaetaceae bacterium]